MNTFLKKISCGSNFTIEFSSAVKLEFGIPADAYISFVVSERGEGRKIVFEKGKAAGSPYENWSLEITPEELNCELENQIFENNNIYDYRIVVYSENGAQSFYLECYLLTKDIFSFENVAYKAVVLSYAPGYYKEDDSASEVQTVRFSFPDYKNDLIIDSKYLNPENTSIFGFDYVLEQNGGHDNLVFKSGTYTLEYDENTGLWYVPKEKLRDGEWNYEAQINPVSWRFSTKFGWIDGDYLNAETGVAMHSYRRGFSYADEPSASGWTFGAVQSNNFNYKNGLTAETSDGLTGGPTQKLSVLQNDIRNTIDPNWEIFKSRYYDRYNIRGFQLNGVERTVGSSVYSLNTVGSPIIDMNSDLNLFIQNVELESSSGLSNRIEKEDTLIWTSVLDAQSRNVRIVVATPSGYTFQRAMTNRDSGIDFTGFDFDLDVPVGVGESDYFKYHSSWPIDDKALTPISKAWAFPTMYLESAGTYWILAGFTRLGSERFIQQGNVSDNIVDIASEPNHYLWNVGDIWTEGYDTTGENVIVNNLDGNGPIYRLWGRANAITLTFSFDKPSEESSYVPPVESSSSGELPSDSSSSSWNENWATEGYLLEKLQVFVDYLGQIGKTAVSQNLVSTSQIVDALDTIMENVGGLETSSSSLTSADSGEVVTLDQVQNSFNAIETRFSAVSDMAYAYGNTQFTKVSQFSAALFGLNNQLVAIHSETPTISGGSGEIAFKADVDDILESKITKYVSIAENVLNLKSALDSETSIGLVYLSDTTVSLCNCLSGFGLPNSRDITRAFESSKTVLRGVDKEDLTIMPNRGILPNRVLNLEYELGFGCCVRGGSIVDFGNHLVDTTKRFSYTESADAYFERTYYPAIGGYLTITIIVPTFVNFGQADYLNWDLGGSIYPEQSVELESWGMRGFYHDDISNMEKGLERIESHDESIVIGKCNNYGYTKDFLKYLTSAQKKVVSNTWDFPRMLTLTLSNTNLEIESNAFTAIGTYVQREPPFPEWKTIYALAGMGTKIVLSIGAHTLLSKQGFPFGASTKHYFKCVDPTAIDAGYVIYDGTQWIFWQSLIDDDYFGHIPNWPNDVVNADNKYLDLTYNSNMDHGVLGTIPDWNNVESANNTFKVNGNNGESPVCTSPGVWRQARDTSSVYGVIPKWKNVTSACGTYYNQGFLDSVWDITRPFSEIMPSTVAHDENTVKGTSFALRAYFTAEWGGILEEIDSLSENGCYVIFLVGDVGESLYDWGKISASYVHGDYIYSGLVCRISYVGTDAYATSDYLVVPRAKNNFRVCLFIQKRQSEVYDHLYLSTQGCGQIETIIGISDFSKNIYHQSVKSSVKRVNVCSVNHDVSGFEDFTELAIVEIIPGTTTSGQNVLPNCFKNCVKLETVILPNCTTVGAEAFSGCGKVASMKLGTLSSLGSNCFSGIGSSIAVTQDTPVLDGNFITTFVEVANTAVSFCALNGFTTGWGAGDNVCFKCGDGTQLTMQNGQWVPVN